MNDRLKKFTKVMMNAMPSSYTEERGVLKTINSFDFYIVDDNIVDNVFSFENIDDFKNMITEFDRGIDVDLVIDVLNNKLSIKNTNPNSCFNLQIITS
jgi:hypothetical protein